MNGARRLAIASLAASAAALTLGFVSGETEILILPLGILAAIGLIGEARGSGWTPTLWFLGQTSLCALARPSPIWALISISTALAYWDLSAFHRRMVKAGHTPMPGLLLRRHLLFLSVALGVGAVLGFAALRAKIASSFAGALLFGLVALAGLSQLLRRARVPAAPEGRPAAVQAERNS